MIYFDNNATTKLSENALAKMLEVMQEHSNPSSAHSLGRKARILVEKSRSKILDFLRTKKHKLVFTCSGTEANNLILSNFAKEKVLISSVEHPSIYSHCEEVKNRRTTASSLREMSLRGAIGDAAISEFLEESKIKHLTKPPGITSHSLAMTCIVNVDTNGRLNLAELREKLSSGNYKLLSVIYANNETGVLQNIKEIAKIAHEFGCMLHSDLSQAIGKIPCDLEDLGIDFATFSAHKFHGPIGCGGLIYRSDFHIKPQILGGGQEMGMRSGTENVPAIIGAAAALEEVVFDDYVKNLQDHLESEILKSAPDAVIFGKEANRLPNTSMISMPNVDFNIQVMQFDLEDIAISSGSACSSARITGSRILAAMNIDERIAKSAIRVSLSRENNMQEIERFVEVWRRLSLRGG
jgi:cysteine desulfurase